MLSSLNSTSKIFAQQTSASLQLSRSWTSVMQRQRSNKVEHVKTFCGGLATASPGTSTMESDFSVVKWEKDDCQIGLTDFSLEGFLHDNQFTKLQSMSLYHTLVSKRPDHVP